MVENNYPIEKQVCSLEQAKKLAELLGEDAPPSWWYWRLCLSLAGDKFNLLGGGPPASGSQVESYPAYTGDELGALLLGAGAKPGFIPVRAHARAKEVIEGLREGWIKKEEFKYD